MNALLLALGSAYALHVDLCDPTPDGPRDALDAIGCEGCATGGRGRAGLALIFGLALVRRRR